MILVFEWLWKTGKLSVNRANTGSQLRCIALFSNGRTRIAVTTSLALDPIILDTTSIGGRRGRHD